MPTRSVPDRSNQRHRTRKDLLTAAARLMKTGRVPDMDEVAQEAMVSRATAYRYFPNIESLLLEAPLDGAAPDPAELFANDNTDDPITRLDRAESRLHDMCVRNEASLRLMLAARIEQVSKATTSVPVRQNRRSPLIEAALAPARQRFSRGEYEKLVVALAMIFGPEAIIALKDVVGIDDKAARKIKSWAIRGLVNSALSNSRDRVV